METTQSCDLGEYQPSLMVPKDTRHHSLPSMAAVPAQSRDEFEPSPIENSMLRFLTTHRSCAVWEGKDPGALKCRGRNDELRKRRPIVVDSHKQMLTQYTVGSPMYKQISALLKYVERLYRITAKLPLEEIDGANPDAAEGTGQPSTSTNRASHSHGHHGAPHQAVSRPDPPPPPHASPAPELPLPPHASPTPEFPPPPHASPSLEIPPRTAHVVPDLEILLPTAHASSYPEIPSHTSHTFFDPAHLPFTPPSFDLGYDFSQTPPVMHTLSPSYSIGHRDHVPPHSHSMSFMPTPGLRIDPMTTGVTHISSATPSSPAVVGSSVVGSEAQQPDVHVENEQVVVGLQPPPQGRPKRTTKAPPCGTGGHKAGHKAGPAITHMEMIKGIKGHGYYDELVVPIIENTAYEFELTESLAKAIEAYPKTTAVLVRNHGIYIWGDSWISAKTQAECYHYLFDAAIKLHQLGLDCSTPDHGPIRNVKGVLGCGGHISTSVKAGADSNHEIEPLRRCIVLDIEGTTTPISFVTEVLFPYARGNVGKHLSATYDTAETQDDIKLLRSQVQDDLKQGVVGAVPIPSDDAGKEDVIAALVANVEAMIRADRKITALKQLQGHIWQTGYENNELEGVVFEDVPEALEKWHALGTKVYIYSSGSTLAQRLIFGNTNYGDLRKYLSGFFDTTVGNKRETRSYVEISKSLGVDKPSEILFVTDVYQEAVAAKAAGR
ncbi:putative bifunctional methylthioribulose-1-phosphate dehydratase/enolase-phosphatase e1 [Quercus suber]|uniref:Bifunctional methylthioribulose-1-phosphate dehydratase/enolase-phosphatase e1 n=1 Tax=Quercus suber TaxID=58331 RepID=A0AAW0KFY6_QUESU